MNRKKRTAINSFIGIIYKLVCMIFPFIIRTLIIKTLGDEYAGLNSLFTSIISALSLMELGVGSAVVYCMYKPIAEGDDFKVCSLLNYIKKFYFRIGSIILVIGFATIPFLQFLINGSYPNDINIYVLFLMYLFNLVFGYYFYGYTTTIFLANQRNDIISIVSLIIFIVQYVLQIVILVSTHNYTAYIFVYSILVIPQNILYRFFSKKMYPQYRCYGMITNELKSKIRKEVSSLLGHKIGAVVLVNIDSTLISAFIGLTELGKYGNYYYIFSSIIALTTIIAQSLQAGIGAKIVIDNKERTYLLFNKLTMAWILLVTICSSCLIGLLNPFISMIFGFEYCYNTYIVLVIVLYYYSWQFRNMGLIFKDAAGLWSIDWYKPYLGMAINLIGSIYLLNMFNSVACVLIPTIFVMGFIYFPIETFVLHKNLFTLPSRPYFVFVFKMCVYSFLVIALSLYICNYLLISITLKSLIIRFFFCVSIPVILFIIVFHRDDYFKELMKDINIG